MHVGRLNGVLIAGCLAGIGILALVLVVAPRLSLSGAARKVTATTNQVSITPLVPLVSFEPEELVAGKLLQQETVVRTFRLRNRSDRVMQIVTVQTTCECTMVDTNLVGKPLMPRSELPVSVRFDGSTRSGPMTAMVEVTLRSDAASHLTARGYLKVMVIPDFACEPRFLEFGRVRPGESVTQTIRFRPQAFQDLQLPPANASYGPFEMVVHDLNVTVTFRAPAIAHRETYFLPLNVHTTSPRVPMVTIPLSAQVVPELEVIPHVLVFANTAPTGASRLKFLADKPFRIIGLLQEGGSSRVTLPLLSATAAPITEWSRSHVLMVTNQTIAKADRLEAELQFSHDADRTETRSVFVCVKRLGETNPKNPQ